MFLHGVQCHENKKMNVTSQLTVHNLFQSFWDAGCIKAQRVSFTSCVFFRHFYPKTPSLSLSLPHSEFHQVHNEKLPTYNFAKREVPS